MVKDYGPDGKVNILACTLLISPPVNIAASHPTPHNGSLTLGFVSLSLILWQLDHPF
jgi:hypothetical protein